MNNSQILLRILVLFAAIHGLWCYPGLSAISGAITGIVSKEDEIVEGTLEYLKEKSESAPVGSDLLTPIVDWLQNLESKTDDIRDCVVDG